MPEFDKYAPYVWTCYLIAVVILGGLVVWTMFRAREARKRLDAVEDDSKSEGKAP